jgi:hypothetical protein
MGNPIKMAGATALSGTDLCRTCRFATIIQGQAPSQRLVECADIGRSIPFVVTECTSYSDKRIPSRRDMEDIAWVIRTKRVGKPAGFAANVAVDSEVEVKPTEVIIDGPRKKFPWEEEEED